MVEILELLAKYRFKIYTKPEHGKFRITIVNSATNDSCSCLYELDDDEKYFNSSKEQIEKLRLKLWK